MLKWRIIMLAALLPLVINGANMSACGTPGSNKAMPNAKPLPQSPNKKDTPGTNQNTPREVGETVSDDLKILAEGGFSRVADTLLIVARDAETYAALRAEAAPNLPEMKADFFKSNAVVAAFLGTRRTGGYAVDIARAANNAVRVSASSPEGGGISAQVISSPYKIVAVPLTKTDETLPLEIGDAWKTSMRPYRITEGNFTMSGGIAGRGEQFHFDGELRVMRFGKLATIAFALKSTGGAKPRVLNNVSTGIVGGDEKITLTQLDAGSFVDDPHSALSAVGQFTNKESYLTFAFTALAPNVADGYNGSGTLKAVATAPAPPKRNPALIDEM